MKNLYRCLLLFLLSLCETVFFFVSDAAAFQLTKKDERGKVEVVPYVWTEAEAKTKRYEVLKEWQNKVKGTGTCSLYDSDRQMECRCNIGLFWQDDMYGHKNVRCDKRLYYLKMVDGDGGRQDYVILRTPNKKLTSEKNFISGHFKGTASCSLGEEKTYEVITCKCNKGLVHAIIPDSDRNGDDMKNIWNKPSRFSCGCQAGYEVRNGVCVPCPKGSSTNGSSGVACTPCKAGTYAEKTGAVSCTSCPAGHSTNGGEGASECFGCTAGYYAKGTGNAKCTACASGSYSKGTGNDICTTKPPHAFCATGFGGSCVNNAATDFKCEDGYTKTDTACVSSCPAGCSACTSADACTGCVKGYYKSGGSCKSCPKNATCAGKTETFQCNKNFYKSGSACKACPENATCAGKSETFQCNKNFYKSGGACKACPKNVKSCSGDSFVCADKYYKDGDKCVACVANASSCKSATDFTCADKYYKSGNSCLQCPQNQAKCKPGSCSCTSKSALCVEVCATENPPPVPTECEKGYALKGNKCLKKYAVVMKDEIGDERTELVFDETEKTLKDILDEMNQAGSGLYTCLIEENDISCSCAKDRSRTKSNCETVASYAVYGGGSPSLCVVTDENKQCGVIRIHDTVESCKAGLYYKSEGLYKGDDGTYCYKPERN